MILDDTPLFDPTLLSELDWSQNMVKFSPEISPISPGDGLILRPLCTADFNRGLFKVLAQLTKVGDVEPEVFIKKFEHMKQTGDYYNVVVEDTHVGQVIATATLIIEHKFIHTCAKRGRIEEVVVSDEHRGKQLGKLIISVSKPAPYSPLDFVTPEKGAVVGVYVDSSCQVGITLKGLLVASFLFKKLVAALTLLSKKLNCYKITLECLPKNKAFYQKFGYKVTEELYMQCRFFD